ncbi:glucosamine-6-phosphate deaminase [Paenibacillus filicis]|uniref:Glucosamine-6-phosphate deaminase n=1 Tax=Paenibacillus filicis TaxID=669464 RepID=A0ABU9DCW2_9BACL
MTNECQPVMTHVADKLRVNVYEDRRAMGAAAAAQVGARLRELLASKGQVRMVFAAAPSQDELYQGLVQERGIDWSRITAFHMDEYIGLSESAPQRFGNYLNDRLFSLVQPGRVELLDSTGSIEEECARYSAMLREGPIDIVCLGIGENGHIAFNDPPVADFEDPRLVKAVELDRACRQQQVNDGCFPELEAVPTHAITLTIPALMSGEQLYGIVPGVKKRHAVQQTVHGPITTACPASILRTHPRATMYLDTDSFGQLG